VADKTCPNCGKTLSAEAPLGLCPECLMKAGFNTGTAPDGSGASRGFPPPPVDTLRPLFPQLELLELIGKGGMGAVYKARQPGLDRLVALKILPAGVAGDPGFADRFNREARALARLQHPHIVAVHDFGIAGGLHYLLMEYVDGPNLRQVQRSGGMTPAQALRIVPEICAALQFAHDRGIVHRDIKPENLLLDRDGHVKITDFGIAKLMDPEAETMSLTGAIDVIGTPHYMAPEQIEKPADVDHRADIYSLGVVFYELLTGELPIGRFAAPSHRVQLDVRLDEVVLRSLEKEPAKRYQQVSQVKTQLDTIAGSAPAATIAPSAPAVGFVAQRRRRVTALPAIVLYVLQAVLLAVGAHYWMALTEDVESVERWEDPWLWFAYHLIALVLAYVGWCVLHYSCWAALPPPYRSTTPGRAVGFLFIPGFNAYWIFVSLGKLAEGYNAFHDEHGDVSIRNAWGLAIAKAISLIAVWTIGWFPSIGAVVCLVDAALFLQYYRAIGFNANQVIEREGRPAAVAL
jgi:predicted Ser/Thr protein kinase